METKFTPNFLALAAFAALLGACATPVTRLPTPNSSTKINDVEIGQSVYIEIRPTLELQRQRVYLTVPNSQKATKLLQDKLAERGFTVVATPEEATAKFTVAGAFSISKFAMKPKTGELAELLETTDMSDLEPSSSANDGSGRLVAALISPSQLIKWVGIQSGARDWFNKILTGDPRGICTHKDCNNYSSWVVITVTGDNGNWKSSSQAESNKMVIDVLVADALESALQPLYDIAPVKNPPASQAADGAEE